MTTNTVTGAATGSLYQHKTRSMRVSHKQERSQVERAQASRAQAIPVQTARAAKLIGAVLVALSAISWGISGVFAQYLTQGQGVAPSWLNCARMVGAAVLLLPLAFAKKDTRHEIKAAVRNKKDLRNIAIYAIFGAFACQVGYLYTITYTNSGTATMFEQSGMVIVMAVTCLTVKRFPTYKEIAALLLALTGVFCFCTQGSPTSLAISTQGFVWGIFAAIGMALYIILPGHLNLLEKFNGLTVTTLAMCIAGVVISIFLRPWTVMPTLNAPIVLGTLGTIVFGTIIAYLLFLKGMKLVGPIVGGLLDAIEPVTALVLSALWLGTSVTIWDTIGCAFIIGMIVLITLPDKKGEETH